MRIQRICISAILILITVVPLLAQRGRIAPPMSRPSPPPPQNASKDLAKADEHYKAKSELVLVPVVVTDGSGGHVTGLKQQDFTVKDHGKPQRITVFEEIKAAPAARVRKVSVPENAKVFTNQLADQTPKRLVILVMDAINTRMLDQAYARQQLISFLAENVDSGAVLSLVVIGRGGRIRVIHDFTTDPNLLIAALKKVRNIPDATSSIAVDQGMADALNDEINTLQAFADNDPHVFVANSFARSAASQQRFAILDTLDAMQQIARAYGGVPGRKALVWATGGFPFTISGSDGLISSARGIAPDGLIDVLPAYEKTWQVLNDTNTAVYPVDVRGLVNTAFIGADTTVRSSNPQVIANAIRRQQDRFRDSIDTMNTFADMTGGQAFYNTNDLKHSFKRASDDSAAYYLLGYYLDRDAKPGWHKLHVNVEHSGVHVRARSGFFVTAATQDFDAARKSDIAQAVASPLDFTGVPLRLEWKESVRQDGSPKRKIKFDLSLPGSAIGIDDADNNHMSLEFVGVARTREAEQVADFVTRLEGRVRPERIEQLRREGLTANGTLDIAPGNYLVRFVVRDSITGRLGSLIAPLKVE